MLAPGNVALSPCIFARALLARCVGCELAQLQARAESQTVACSKPEAHSRCGQLYALLRAKSVFALKQRQTGRAMPHALAMKLECGGLQGLQQALEMPGPTPDIQQLLSAAQVRFGSLEDLPFERIVGSIVHWQGRRRAKHGSNPAGKS